MSRIRKLYYFDKKKTQEMISFLNDGAKDNYINNVMFNPLIIFHHILPLKLKFLPESFVLKEKSDIKGLITVAPSKCLDKKVEIQKLLFEENSFSIAEELIQFAVSKYKALGAPSIIIKVADYLPELLTLLVSKCSFSQISYEKLWRVQKPIEYEYNEKCFRSFRNSDAQVVASLYNDSLLPHFRPLLGSEPREYKESLFKGLSYYSEYKYIMEDRKSQNVLAYISIQTSDNENYVLDIIQTSWAEIDINAILTFAYKQVKKRKRKFGFFIKSKRYTNIGEKYENIFKQNDFTCIQNQIVLTNSSAKILKDTSKNQKFTAIGEFCSNRVMPITCNEHLD